jgi:hypothetical protein
VLDDADTDRDERRQAFARELGVLEAWAASEPQAFEAVAVHQPFLLAYHEVSNRDVLARYGRLCASLMQGWQRAAGLAAPKRGAAGARIRVGIVSAHFSDHSVWLAFVRGWVQQLDRRRFELHLFHLSAKRDVETDLAISLATEFHDGKGGWENWARFIHASRMDFLLYPEIGMDPTTAKLASLRLAPVQATSWGQPQTSGLPTIDYYLSAEALEPPDAQAHYSEALQLLPGTSCWLPRVADEGRAVQRSDLGLPAADVLMLCPGTPFKYAAEHDALWVEIARRVPGGKLVFFRSRPEALSNRLERRLRSRFRERGAELRAPCRVPALAGSAGVPGDPRRGRPLPRHRRLLRLQHRAAGRALRPPGGDARGTLHARPPGERHASAHRPRRARRAVGRRLRGARGRARERRRSATTAARAPAQRSAALVRGRRAGARARGLHCEVCRLRREVSNRRRLFTGSH